MLHHFLALNDGVCKACGRVHLATAGAFNCTDCGARIGVEEEERAKFILNNPDSG